MKVVEGFKSGFVAIIGRPNVGKSTLLNALVGQKLAIVSDKPQTTRNRILAVLTLERGQVVFLDTPGIHKPRHKLGEYMVATARSTLKEVDLILFVVDASAELGTGDRLIADYLKEVSTPVILAVNKIDLVSKGEIPRLMDSFRQLHQFAQVVPLSALNGYNLQELLDQVLANLPEGPKYYPDDMVTDQPERFIVAELVREKVLLLTRDEVPHSVAVDVEEISRRRDDLVYVRTSIYVEKDSQKGILIGQGGRMLKEIGRLAREEIENLLGSRIYLDLWVKVKKDWRDSEAGLRSLGYHP